MDVGSVYLISTLRKKTRSAGKMLKDHKKMVLHARLCVLNCRNEIMNHHDMQVLV